MEFNQLESFLKVVKYKSFSRAAKELYLTQPTVSNNIQNLEKELDTVLLDRKSKNISLTESGKVFYEYAMELINLREQAVYNIKDHFDRMDGTIEINASTIPEQYVLPYIIRDFIRVYPKVKFSIVHRNSKAIVDEIVKGRLNFGIVGAKYGYRELEYIDFCQDEIILAGANRDRYREFQNKDLGIRDLLGEDFILRREGSGTRTFIEQGLLDKEVSLDELKIHTIADSNEMIKKMIELDLGISFISKMSIKKELAMGSMLEIALNDLKLERKFYFVYSKNRTLPPMIDKFKEFLLSMDL